MVDEEAAGIVDKKLIEVGRNRLAYTEPKGYVGDESGQGLVEYALIIALVAVGLIAILLVLRNSIGNVFNNAATQLNNAPANPYP